jgi:hypothetical protein
MEIVEIKSSHNLMNSILDKRQAEAHSYKISCHQFMSVYRSWLKEKTAQPILGVMTLAFERIWISKEEGTLIVSAIQQMRSPLEIA